MGLYLFWSSLLESLNGTLSIRFQCEWKLNDIKYALIRPTMPLNVCVIDVVIGDFARDLSKKMVKGYYFTLATSFYLIINVNAFPDFWCYGGL